MEKLMHFVGKLRKNESGASMVEYGLMVALIAIVCIIAITAIGTNLNTAFDKVQNAIAAANAKG